jgi:hypothetical protein
MLRRTFTWTLSIVASAVIAWGIVIEPARTAVDPVAPAASPKSLAESRINAATYETVINIGACTGIDDSACIQSAFVYRDKILKDAIAADLQKKMQVASALLVLNFAQRDIQARLRDAKGDAVLEALLKELTEHIGSTQRVLAAIDAHKQ